MHNPRLERLRIDHQSIKELSAQSPYVRILKTIGEPPTKYLLELSCKGIKRLKRNGQADYVNSFHLEINLPLDYPRLEPRLRFLSPCFHPNIIGETILLEHTFSPSVKLTDLVIDVLKMIRFEAYDRNNVLNRQAVTWIQENTSLLPLENTPLRLPERKLEINIEPNPSQEDDLMDEIVVSNRSSM